MKSLINNPQRLNEITFASQDIRTEEEKKWVHFCGDWDGLAITPACDEWECCGCYSSEVKKQKEDDFFKAYPDVERPRRMSDMYDDMSEEEMQAAISTQEDYEAWMLAQQPVIPVGLCANVNAFSYPELQDDFALLSLSAAELPDEKWNPENG